MNRLLGLALLALGTLNGCIYYEGGGAGCGGICWDDDDDGDWDDWDGWGDDEDSLSGDAPDDDGYTCFPDAADPGDTVIVDVIADDGTGFDDCTDVQIFGDCELLTYQLEDGNLTLVVSVDEEATGSCDLLLEFGDDTVEFVEDAIDCDGEPGESSTEDEHTDPPADGADDDCPE